MDWRAAALAVSVFVGFGSGVVFAKEYGARLASSAVATFPDIGKASSTPVGVATFPDVTPARGKAADPALALLATNPYEAQLAPYRTALNVDGEHPLLEDPYEDTRRFVNPYENTVGIANPYVDALRESEMKKQARLDNPYTKQLRDQSVDLENPYTRRR